MKLIITLSFYVLLLSSIKAQCLLFPSSIEERFEAASIVIEGKVVDQESYFTKNGKFIETAYTLSIIKIIKGEHKHSTLKIVLPGGNVKDHILKVFPNLELKQGDEGIFTLRKINDKFRPTHNYGSFFHKYGENGFIDPFGKSISTSKWQELTGDRSQISSLARNTTRKRSHTISSISPTNVTAGVDETITISGSGFTSTQGSVQFRNPDTGGASNTTGSPSEVISWSDTEIVVQVPSKAGDGPVTVVVGAESEESAININVDYAITNLSNGGDPDPPYFINVDQSDEGGFIFEYSTSTAANGLNFTTVASGAAMTSFESALSTWQSSNAETGFYICGESTVNDATGDGTNIIMFDNDNTDIASFGEGVLGVFFSYYLPCSGEVEMYEGDMVFRKDGDQIGTFNGNPFFLNWNFSSSNATGSEYDFQSVAAHELGHGNQLGHVIASGELMHYQLFNGSNIRTLSTNDQNAGEFMKTRSLNYDTPCGPPEEDYEAFDNTFECATVPLDLISFNVDKKEGEVQVEWSTTNEVNVSHYKILKTINDQTYIELGRVEAENKIGETLYRFNDVGVIRAGTTTYTLISEDYDGTYVNQGSRNIFEEKSFELVQKNRTLEIYVDGNTEIGIYALNGKLLRKKTLSKGINFMDLEDLKSGIYIMYGVNSPSRKLFLP